MAPKLLSAKSWVGGGGGGGEERIGGQAAAPEEQEETVVGGERTVICLVGPVRSESPRPPCPPPAVNICRH